VLALLLYRVLCGVFGLLIRMGVDDRDLEIAVLRHQLRVLSRRGKRPCYRSTDRALLAAASRFLPRERWSALPVTPDTLTRWHRHLLSRKRSRRRRGPGRPPIDAELRGLILRMARENPRWGYLRIKGELLKLGIRVSATTIANVLRRGGLGPAPRRIGPTWSQFLRVQALAILATGTPGSGQPEDRHEEARALPARDAVGPSLEEECCPSEAPAVAPPFGFEQGPERPQMLTLDRPSRMHSVPRPLIGGTNPRDGPATAPLRLPIGVPGGLQHCRARIAAESGVTPLLGSSEPAGNLKLTADRCFRAIVHSVALADRVLVPHTRGAGHR
jgi:hypothetical protein